MDSQYASNGDLRQKIQLMPFSEGNVSHNDYPFPDFLPEDLLSTYVVTGAELTDKNDVFGQVSLNGAAEDNRQVELDRMAQTPNNETQGWAELESYAEDVIDALENEIKNSVQPTVVSIKKPPTKKEIRLVYRVEDCLCQAFIGTRHMKTFSMNKYGDKEAWVLARAAAKFMETEKRLPVGFPMPSLPSRGSEGRHFRNEMNYYCYARLSGTFGSFENPRPIEPLVYRGPTVTQYGKSRGRPKHSPKHVIDKSFVEEKVKSKMPRVDGGNDMFCDDFHTV